MWDEGEKVNQSKESPTELKDMQRGILNLCSALLCIVYGMPSQVLLMFLCMCVCVCVCCESVHCVEPSPGKTTN